MGVHADRRFPEGDGHHQIGRLAADSGEGDQLFHRFGDHSAEPGQRLGQTCQVSRLIFIKTDRIDKGSDFFLGKGGQSLQVRRHGKKPCCGRRGGFVLGPGREDGGDQDLEGILGLDGDQVDNRYFFIAYRLRDHPKKDIDIDHKRLCLVWYSCSSFL